MPLHPSHIPNVKTFIANLTHAIDHKESIKLGGGIFYGTELHSVRMALEQVVRDVENKKNG